MVKQNPHLLGLKQESYGSDSDNAKQPQEPFFQLQIPLRVPFFVRLDGRRFQVVSRVLEAEKLFDKEFSKCLVACGKAIFQTNLASTLVFVANDEVSALFVYTAPFNLRVEKIDSVLASTASRAFALNALRHFKRSIIVAFDSRIAMTAKERRCEYLTWRQQDTWRDHNNTYACWLLRRFGHEPSEIAKKLNVLKTKDLHELLFRHGINSAKTPARQRRGILIRREVLQKRVKTQTITLWHIKGSWNLTFFSPIEGQARIQQVVECAKLGNRGTDIA